jgi:hypothetical protein
MRDNSHLLAHLAESRPLRVREANERMAKTATRLRFVSRVPFLCECDDHPDCSELVLLTLEDYDAAKVGSITAVGHAPSALPKPPAAPVAPLHEM